jgi:protein-disulfide isomerase
MSKNTNWLLAGGFIFTGLAGGVIGALIGSGYVAKEPRVTVSTGDTALVREALMAEPEIIREAMRELERRELAALVDRHAEAIYKSPKDFAVGNPDGDITLVEFFDYNCGYCKRTLADVNRLLENDPNLRIVFKEFPILSEGSLEAARLSLAAGKQGKYIEFHRAVMNTTGGEMTGERALRIAEEIGLDTEQLQKDAKAGDIDQAIGEVFQLANALHINGTPGFVVGRDIISGAVGYDELVKRIERARKAAKVARN